MATGTAKSMLRKVAIAGVAGFGCGRLVKLARDNPDTAVPIIKYTAVAGGVGLVSGFVVAKRRKAPLHIYSVSLGANFAVMTALFFSLREAAQYVAEQCGYRPEQRRMEYQASSFSGGIAGATSSVVSRLGLISACSYAVGGAALGATGQFAYNRFERWRLAKALELYHPELAPTTEKKTKGEKSLQSSFLALEQRILAFAHREGNYSIVEREVNGLTEDIKNEQAAIELLNEQLALSSTSNATDTIEQTQEHKQRHSSH